MNRTQCLRIGVLPLKNKTFSLVFSAESSSSWICLSLGTVVRYTASWLTSYLAFRTISFQSCRPSANPLHHFYIFQRFIFWRIEPNAVASGVFIAKQTGLKLLANCKIRYNKTYKWYKQNQNQKGNNVEKENYLSFINNNFIRRKYGLLFQCRFPG